MAQNARLSIGQAGGVPQGEANTDELEHERHILENIKGMKKAQAPHLGEKKNPEKHEHHILEKQKNPEKAQAPYSGRRRKQRTISTITLFWKRPEKAQNLNGLKNMSTTFWRKPPEKAGEPYSEKT